MIYVLEKRVIPPRIQGALGQTWKHRIDQTSHGPDNFGGAEIVEIGSLLARQPELGACHRFTVPLLQGLWESAHTACLPHIWHHVWQDRVLLEMIHDLSNLRPQFGKGHG